MRSRSLIAGALVTLLLLWTADSAGARICGADCGDRGRPAVDPGAGDRGSRPGDDDDDDNDSGGGTATLPGSGSDDGGSADGSGDSGTGASDGGGSGPEDDGGDGGSGVGEASDDGGSAGEDGASDGSGSDGTAEEPPTIPTMPPSDRPDVPPLGKVLELEGGYADVSATYDAVEQNYASQVSSVEPVPSTEAEDIVDELQQRRTQAAAHVATVDAELAGAGEASVRNREQAVVQSRAAVGTTAGDPVEVATGVFTTEETDFSFSHGELEIAARRRYRSARGPAGSFGVLWSWPFDSRVIRGTQPGAEADFAESTAALETVREELEAALADVEETFGEQAVAAPEEFEEELSLRVEALGELLEEILEAREEARDIHTEALNLAEEYADWTAPAGRNADLIRRLTSLAETVNRETSHLERTLGAFRRAREELAALHAAEAELREARDGARRVFELSAAAQEANRHADRSADPDYLSGAGLRTVTIVDETGTPVVYRIVTEPVFPASHESGGDLRHHYPDGARTEAVDSRHAKHGLRIDPDGSYVWRRADGRTLRYSPQGLLVGITDRNGNGVQLDYRGGRVTSIADDVGRSVRVRWENGRIIEVVDPLGNRVGYSYDSRGRLAGVEDRVGDVIEYGYEDTRLTEIRKPDGTARRYHYEHADGGWKTVSTVDEEGNAEYFRYYPERGYTEHENPSGITTCYHYDERLRTVRTRYADGSEVRIAYDERDNRVARTDERGHSWRYEYDSSGFLTARTDPRGRRTEWRRHRYGGATEHIDALGRRTRITRDDAGNPTKVLYADGITEEFRYDRRGRLISATGRDGGTTRYAYGEYGYLERIEHPDGKTEHLDHDALGRIVRHVDETGVVTRYEHRADGLLAARVREEAGGGAGREHRISFEYDERKDRIRRRGPKGGVTRYRYDARHLPLEIENPAGERTHYRYRPDGRLSRVRIPGISTTVYRYDERGRLSEVRILETDRRSRFRYDSAGNLVARVSPSGATTRYGYSAVGRLLWREGPVGGRRSFVYDAVGNIVSVTDARGFETRFSYDAVDRAVSITGPRGYTSSRAYRDAAGTVLTTDPAGNTTVLEYDARERLVSRTDRRGRQELWSYDGAGRLTAYADRTGARTELRYDGFGRPIEIEDPTGSVRRFSYDEAGNVVSATDGIGNRTTYLYDELGRRVRVTDPAGYATHFGYDALSNVTDITLPDGTKREYRYNASGELVLVREAERNLLQLSYTPNGDIRSRTNAAGETHRFRWDAAGRLVSHTDPAGAETRYGYDAAGNLTAEVDAAGEVYRWEYDAAGNVTAEVNRLGRRAERRYDERGLLVRRVDFGGGVSKLEYDELGRLRKVRYGDGSEDRYTYDAEGRLARAENDAEVLVWEYDPAGRLVRATSAASGVEVHYRYDAAGNRVESHFQPAGIVLNYAYNERGLLASVSTRAAAGRRRRLATFTYDELRREIRRTYANGVTTRRAYTPHGLLAALSHRARSDGVRFTEAYLYDEAGRRTMRVDETGRLTAYAYDDAGRLSEVQYPAASAEPDAMLTPGPRQLDELKSRLEEVAPARKTRLSAVQPVRVEQFSYDVVGNRVRHGVAGDETEYRYDAARRLLSAGELTFGYDANGNLSRVRGPRSKRTLKYSARNRIVEAELERYAAKRGSASPNSMRPRLLAEYRYDALGRRVYRRLARKDDSGRDSIARYLYEGFSVEPVARLALESAGSDDDGAAKTHADSTSRYRYLEPNRPGVLPDGHARVNANARVVLRRGGALVAEVGNQAGRTRYFGLDALRSVVATYGRRGEMVRRQRYDAFGATLSHAQRGGSEREAANGAIPFDVRFGFAGKLRDAATGWYDFGYRDYDPTLGRFTSVDPIKDGGNWYAYVANDPVNRRDPTGLFMVVGPGLGYNRNTDRYQTTDARNLSEKSRIRITRNGDTDAFYDDSMQVEVDALVLTRTPVQSEADWGGFEDQTLPEGEYTGHLLDYSYSYDDPILLVNDDAVTESGHRVSVDFGALIHPNEFTNPERDDEYNQDQPWSKGCQITPGADVYGAVRDEVERLGYEYRPGSTFTEDGETWGSPQTIPVSIKNR